MVVVMSHRLVRQDLMLIVDEAQSSARLCRGCGNTACEGILCDRQLHVTVSQPYSEGSVLFPLEQDASVTVAGR